MIASPPLISVIVPIYNVEPWLGKCVDSILAQSCGAFELILVDDGSTDGSGGVCDAYAARDARIRVLHEANGGVSWARNVGLEAATGRFVCFIDGDDWVEGAYLQTLLDLVSSAGAQLGICGIVHEPDPGGPTRVVAATARTITVSAEHAEALLELNETYLLYGPVNKIYDAQLLRTSGIRFDRALSYGEDLVFNFQCLGAVERIAISDRPLYHYRQSNPDSLSRRFRTDRFEIDMRLFEILHGFFRMHGLLAGKARRWLWTRYFWGLHDSLFMVNDARAGLGWRQRYRRVRQLMAHDRLPEALQFADTERCSRPILACIRGRKPLGFLALSLLLKLKAHAP